MQNKWALEEHLSTAENNALWDSSGESARNGKALTEYVETHLLDVEDRIALMDKTGIERVVLSLTSPGVQSILDTETAVRVARDTNDAVRASYVDKFPAGCRCSRACPPRTPARQPLNWSARSATSARSAR